MVERGQVLERMITFAGPQGRLEGLWQSGGTAGAASSGGGTDGRADVLADAFADVRARRGARGAAFGDDDDDAFGDDAPGAPLVFLPPHPRLGGNMDSPVCAELVWTLGHLRHPSLRFNWSGVGASQGVVSLPMLPPPSPLPSSALDALVDDARAAIAHVKASVGGPVVVVGVSVGALVAARVAGDDDVKDAVYVAPVAAVAPFDVPDGGRVYVGAEDTFVDVDALRSVAPALVVVPGANHTFSRGLPALARAVAEQLGHRQPRR